MKRKLLDIVGTKYGRLEVIEYAGKDANKKTLWKCQCDCGGFTTTQLGNLRSGHTTSCGCVHKKRAREAGKSGVRHGLRHHPLYSTWNSMVHRTRNPNNKDYRNYGARGITVCQEWATDVVAFIEWVTENLGDKPTPTHSIDRVDNNLGYVPGNLRWATPTEQTHNRRPRNVIK